MTDKEIWKLFTWGVRDWNAWREQNPRHHVGFFEKSFGKMNRRGVLLSYAFLQGTSFHGADFTRAELEQTRLKDASMTDSVFDHANFSGAEMRGARILGSGFSHASLVKADLSSVTAVRANFGSADLSGANLRDVYFDHCSFDEADLSDVDLTGAYFRSPSFVGANFDRAVFDNTVFVRCSLDDANNLTNARFFGPCSIDVDTMLLSTETDPSFYRGAGLPETFLTYMKSLTTRAIDYYSCFISYSHADKGFARRLYDALQGRGIRCWLDEHQLLPGQDIYDETDHGIRLWDKTLLCCSKASLSSWWVDKEVATAFDKEQKLMKERGKKVLALIPLNLDDYLFDSAYGKGYGTEVRRRLAANFTGWEHDNKKFESEFERLVRALQTDGGREDPPKPKL